VVKIPVQTMQHMGHRLGSVKCCHVPNLSKQFLSFQVTKHIHKQCFICSSSDWYRWFWHEFADNIKLFKSHKLFIVLHFL